MNRPYVQVSPRCGPVGTVETSGTLDYNALLVRFQRRFANGFSFLNSYTYGKAIDITSDNDGAPRPSPTSATPATTAGRPTTT